MTTPYQAKTGAQVPVPISDQKQKQDDFIYKALLDLDVGRYQITPNIVTEPIPLPKNAKDAKGNSQQPPHPKVKKYAHRIVWVERNVDKVHELFQTGATLTHCFDQPSNTHSYINLRTEIVYIPREFKPIQLQSDAKGRGYAVQQNAVQAANMLLNNKRTSQTEEHHSRIPELEKTIQPTLTTLREWSKKMAPLHLSYAVVTFDPTYHVLSLKQQEAKQQLRRLPPQQGRPSSQHSVTPEDLKRYEVAILLVWPKCAGKRTLRPGGEKVHIIHVDLENTLGSANPHPRSQSNSQPNSQPGSPGLQGMGRGQFAPNSRHAQMDALAREKIGKDGSIQQMKGQGQPSNMITNGNPAASRHTQMDNLARAQEQSQNAKGRGQALGPNTQAATSGNRHDQMDRFARERVNDGRNQTMQQKGVQSQPGFTNTQGAMVPASGTRNTGTDSFGKAQPTMDTRNQQTQGQGQIGSMQQKTATAPNRHDRMDQLAREQSQQTGQPSDRGQSQGALVQSQNAASMGRHGQMDQYARERQAAGTPDQFRKGMTAGGLQQSGLDSEHAQQKPMPGSENTVIYGGQGQRDPRDMSAAARSQYGNGVPGQEYQRTGQGNSQQGVPYGPRSGVNGVNGDQRYNNGRDPAHPLTQQQKMEEEAARMRMQGQQMKDSAALMVQGAQQSAQQIKENALQNARGIVQDAQNRQQHASNSQQNAQGMLAAAERSRQGTGAYNGPDTNGYRGDGVHGTNGNGVYRGDGANYGADERRAGDYRGQGRGNDLSLVSGRQGVPASAALPPGMTQASLNNPSIQQQGMVNNRLQGEGRQTAAYAPNCVNGAAATPNMDSTQAGYFQQGNASGSGPHGVGVAPHLPGARQSPPLAGNINALGSQQHQGQLQLPLTNSHPGTPNLPSGNISGNIPPRVNSPALGGLVNGSNGRQINGQQGMINHGVGVPPRQQGINGGGILPQNQMNGINQNMSTMQQPRIGGMNGTMGVGGMRNPINNVGRTGGFPGVRPPMNGSVRPPNTIRAGNYNNDEKRGGRGNEEGGGGGGSGFFEKLFFCFK